MESIKIKIEPDAVPNASTCDETSRVTVAEVNTAASGLQPSVPPSGAFGHTSGEPTRVSTPVPQQVSTKAASFSSVQSGVVLNLVSEEESSDNDSVLTQVPDNVSLCSEKSGLTVIGEEVNQLKLNADSGFVKLTSAERRRFKKAKASGLSREKALEVAKKNFPLKPEVKRVRSEEKSPELPVTKRPKTAHVGTVKPTYSQVVGSIKLGLTPVDVVNRPLTSEQMALLQEAIVDVTIERADGDVRPEFEGCLPRTGWLLLVCTNAQTADWVRRNFVHIRAKCAFDITLVEEGHFPRSHVIRGYFPQSLSLTNEKVLATIGAQNPFSTAQWKVVQRLTHGQLLHLVLIIDEASMMTITGLKGRIAYRFSHIRLILKDSASGKPSANDGNPAEERQRGAKEPEPSAAPAGAAAVAAGAGTGVGPEDRVSSGTSAGPSAGRTGGGAAGAVVVPLPTRAGGSAKLANRGPKKPAPQGAKKGGTKGPRGAKAAKLIQKSLSRGKP